MNYFDSQNSVFSQVGKHRSGKKKFFSCLVHSTKYASRHKFLTNQYIGENCCFHEVVNNW